ncbi:MAG: FAD:protein FMN transferase [Gammaproteobacteria bacterium]|nr:FAD:protein FMN transferase [Gammaproteobacteria bacterium]MYF29179.1 FAD:protein FMN transferase [Gammaproteobacteria bacterium]MYK48236.1 FAD:protein FMN transferase [Gammaproteobacteria bacterium]
MIGWTREAKHLATTALWATAIALASVGCGFERATGNAMGTTYSIQADCPGPLPRDRIDAELDRLNALLSTYDPHSELSRFNRSPSGVALPVSPELVAVVDAAFVVAEQTRGAFDATVAPLVALWGFGADAAQRAPLDSEVAQALRSVDYRRVAHGRDPPTLEKLLPATLDLSGIAKGFAVDRIAGVLDDAGCGSYLIEFGGEIRASGNPTGGGPWRLGVESPSGADYVRTLLLENGALATSGDYRQYRESDGVRVSHIIDPRTGYPVRHRLASVTVVADTAMMADAMATALLVMGATEATRFAGDSGVAALFVVRVDDGFEVFHSAAMAAYLGRG